MSTSLTVADLKKRSKDDEVAVTLQVRSSETMSTRAGKPFLKLLLGDRTGSIEATKWNHDEETDIRLAPDDLVQIKGRVDVYQNRRQLKVAGLERVAPDGMDLGAFAERVESGVTIEQLKKLPRDTIAEGRFAVASLELRESQKSKKHFLRMVLSDKTGTVDAIRWDNAKETAETIEPNEVVDAKGSVDEFNDRLQFKIQNLTVLPKSEISCKEYTPASSQDVEAMYAEMLAVIDGFANPDLKRLMNAMFRDDEEVAAAFRISPAAKGMHHARTGGLLEHVLSLLKLAASVSSNYEELDGDLLASGVLLHDLGKIDELTSEGGFEMTDDGRLLGHIPIGMLRLEKACAAVGNFPDRLKKLLQHMIASHHGKKEFGSPQEPLFAEAIALHHIDDLDSKLTMMREARAEIRKDKIWSPYRKGLARSVLDKEAYLQGAGEPEPQPDATPRQRPPKTTAPATPERPPAEEAPEQSEPVHERSSASDPGSSDRAEPEPAAPEGNASRPSAEPAATVPPPEPAKPPKRLEPQAHAPPEEIPPLPTVEPPNLFQMEDSGPESAQSEDTGS